MTHHYEWERPVQCLRFRGRSLPRLLFILTRACIDVITPQALDLTENGQVNKLEFCVGMIIALGAEVCGEELEYETHVKPLLARFDRLDEGKSGYLEMDDLAFLVQSSRKNNMDEAAKLRQIAKHEKSLMKSTLTTWRRMSMEAKSLSSWQKNTKAVRQSLEDPREVHLPEAVEEVNLPESVEEVHLPENTGECSEVAGLSNVSLV